MRRILEDLYHGNLTISGQTFRRGTKYARALARVAETEETLSQKWLRKIIRCWPNTQWPAQG